MVRHKLYILSNNTIIMLSAMWYPTTCIHASLMDQPDLKDRLSTLDV